MKRQLLIAALVAASLQAPSALARTDVDLYLNFGPPPVRHEYVPAPRVGYVWIPGYWDYRGSRHVWVAGRHVRHRPGYYWHEPRWVQHDNRWRLDRGTWRRDSDRDGTPDRYDRAPNNPNRS